MPVSFLDIVPTPPSATVTIATTEGPIELEFAGVSLHALADIAKRFPDFAKVLDGGMLNLMENPEAMAAFFAASLGHPGDAEYEARFASVTAGDMIKIWQTCQRLTFAPSDPDPLPDGAAGNGAAPDAPQAPISPSPLSS